mgnify:CR=1 FL=1|jgi:hypothetical protein
MCEITKASLQATKEMLSKSEFPMISEQNIQQVRVDFELQFEKIYSKPEWQVDKDMCSMQEIFIKGGGG